MDLSDRITWMLLGGLIGFVAGYIVRLLIDIRDRVEEVDDHVTERDERGELPEWLTFRNVALGVVVFLTAWAAIMSNNAVNRSQENQQNLRLMTVCNQRYLSQTISALNERTTYSLEQANANVQLQRYQSEFLAVVLERPPETEQVRRQALREYFNALTQFVKINAKTEVKIEQNPYPTNKDLSACLNEREEENPPDG